MSIGFRGRVLVEIKLSTNTKPFAGYEKQLATYTDAEEATRAFYVVLDVGNLKNKDRQLLAVKNREAMGGKPTPEIIFVDGGRRPSASKL
jgi:hypothetical protein